MRAAPTLLLGFAMALAAYGGQNLPLTIDPHAHVLFQVTCSLGNALPPTGVAPVEVTVRNSSGRRASWVLDFSTTTFTWAGGAGRSTNMFQTSFPLSVEAGADRTYRLSVPYAPGSYALQCAVRGTGFEDSAAASIGMSNRASTPGPFLGLAERLASDASDLLKPVDSRYSSFEPKDLSDDWRTLAGFDTLWLRSQDLGGLAVGQRIALQEWVARGGVFFIFGATKTPPEFSEPGFGKVVLRAAEQMDRSRADFVTSNLLHEVPSQRASWFDAAYAATWPAAAHLGRAVLHVWWLSLFLLGLAAVNGPVNLYCFATRARRVRLLWTTPLISVAASVCLIGYILLQDGFGGRGERNALICLLPSQNQAAILQEQVSRTGVTLSRGFHLNHPSYVLPVATLALGGARECTYAVQGQDYSGDWLSSRTQQAQWIETIVPTRAEVRWLNPAGPEAPAIVSSIEAPLEEIYLRTGKGRLWHGAQIRPGEKRTLEPASSLPLLVPDGGAQLSAAWAAVSGRNGYFYATTSASSAFQETFSGIRWEKQRAVYLGPVSQSQP